MRPFDRLSEYLGRVERRMRWLALSRGFALSAGVALAATVLGVLFANRFNFSAPSVTGARLFLFVALGLVLALALIGPLIRLNRRRAAREAERAHPQFEERLLTFSERLDENRPDPFLELLASDTLEVARRAEPESIARGSRILSFSSAAVVAVGVLLWLGTAGPGFLGYGTSLLWGGLPKGELKPFYDIAVDPGSRTVRRKADQVISARLLGFSAQRVRFFAKYASGAAWEQADMKTEPGGAAWEFLLAAVPESLEYYVEAGGVRSKTFKLTVADLPGVKSIRVTYRYPSWTGMPDFTEFPGGDLRAVAGTDAEVAVETDKPLTTGALLLDDGSRIALRQAGDGRVAASVPIRKDGMYHIAAMENGEVVRLSEDFFIEAQQDRPPEVRVSRPGRDFKASPIEEVTVAVDATDDFGLRAVELHYSVNGGAEKVVPVMQNKGARQSKGSTIISLEEFKLQPGDVVSLYATARDARARVNTDMYFIEAQPFEREYSQSQQSGGGGGGGDEGEEQNKISQRQKEIIAATWNQLKGRSGASEAKENAAFLSGVQSKLRDQAKSLANRMRSRQLAGAGDSFKQFVEDMEKAAEAMGPASDQLKGAKWQDALGPEQKALQHLLRAESTFRNIQVAFGQRGGGGGGGGGAQRDLEGLFDLELDTEKNQYESGQQVASGERRQKEIDEALQKLEQLAKRQQELAEQARRQQQMSQQRWQQEMLRREAEQLQRQMEQLMRGQQQGQLSRNQDGQQSRQNQQGQQGQQGQQQARQQGQAGQSGSMGGLESQQLRQAIERLRQATDDMRQSASSQPGGTPQGGAEARRAAERLRDAQQALSRLRQQQSGNQVEDLARQADQLAGQQEGFDRKMRQAFGSALTGQPSLAQPKAPGPREAQQLAEEKQQMLAELKKLEQQMQSAARNLAGTDRKASSKMREALGNMQQEELPLRMQWSADALRRGLGQYAVMRESVTTQALNNLRDQLRDLQRMMGSGDGKDGSKPGAAGDRQMEQALAQVERLRRQMEQMRAGQQGEQGQGRQPGDRQGQQLQRGQPGGQQSGGQQQSGQPGGQPGGRQGGQTLLNGQPPNSATGGPQTGPYGGANAGPRGGGFYGEREGLWNRGPLPPNPSEPAGPRPGDIGTFLRDAQRDLGRLQQAVRTDPALAREIQDLARAMQNIDPKALDNPLVAERIRQQVLLEVEQVEMQIRRKVEDAQGTSARTPPAQSVPPGYADAVAEYFRRLSRGK